MLSHTDTYYKAIRDGSLPSVHPLSKYTELFYNYHLQLVLVLWVEMHFLIVKVIIEYNSESHYNNVVRYVTYILGYTCIGMIITDLQCTCN